MSSSATAPWATFGGISSNWPDRRSSSRAPPPFFLVLEMEPQRAFQDVGDLFIFMRVDWHGTALLELEARHRCLCTSDELPCQPGIELLAGQRLPVKAFTWHSVFFPS